MSEVAVPNRVNQLRSWLLWSLTSAVTAALIYLIVTQLTVIQTVSATGEAVSPIVQPVLNAVVPTQVAGLVAPRLPFNEPLARPPGQILFARGGAVWVWQQGDVRPLTPGTVGAESPRWSPDGSGIAYVTRGRGFADIWIMDSSGQEPRQITRNGNPVQSRQNFAISPAWSPDGKTIAFLSDASSWDMALWMMDAAGRDPRRVSFLRDFTGGLQGLSWMPDGTKVVVAAFFPDQKQQIYQFEVGANRWSPLTRADEGAYDPRVSPDGKYVAYTVRAQGKHDVWVLNREAGVPVQITTDGLSRAPEWSPQTDQLLYLSEQAKSWDIWVSGITVNAEGAVTFSKGRPVTRGLNADPASGLSWLR